MDRYKAVEYLLDWRTDRPSWDDDTVFWRDTGISEEVDDVEARDTGGMTMTDMMGASGTVDSSGVPRGLISRAGATVPYDLGVRPPLLSDVGWSKLRRDTSCLRFPLPDHAGQWCRPSRAR